MKETEPLLSERLLAQDLDPSRIEIHAQRIRQSLSQGLQSTIPVLGACTTSNGGVLPWKTLTRFLQAQHPATERRFQSSARSFWQKNHLVTCIPAAGAASRFLGEQNKWVVNCEGAAPLLKDFVTAWRAGAPLPHHTRETRREALGFLGTFKPSLELQRLPDFLRLQRHEGAKGEFLTLCKALISFFSGLAPATSPRTLPGPQTPSARVRPHQVLPSSSTRVHWAKRAVETYEEELRTQKKRPSPSRTSSWKERVFEPEEPMVSSRAPVDLPLTAADIQNLEIYAASKALVLTYGQFPKALVSTTMEGDTFLDLKLTEQIALIPSLGNVLVVPAFQKDRFGALVESQGALLPGQLQDPFELQGTPFAPHWMGHGKSGRWEILEQGRNLSTIRFDMNGAPVLEEDGNYSPVSAGHGELVHLFRDVADAFPAAECLHIRNIDNVVGSNPDRSQELGSLSDVFRITRDALEVLRGGLTSPLSGHLMSTSAFGALSCLSSLGDMNGAEALQNCFDTHGAFHGIPPETAFHILSHIFHWEPLPSDLNSLQKWEVMANHLSRPLSVFGVVRKETNDVGGGPVFAKTPDGQAIKICLEMPHASEADTREFFGPRGKSTHFNPVLVFFEMKTHTLAHSEHPQAGKTVDFSKLFDDRFWLLTRREHKGKPVCYHETVLYELIGNSATTNVLFVEVPRTLFTPHKVITESLSRDRKSYGFDESLKPQD